MSALACGRLLIVDLWIGASCLVLFGVYRMAASVDPVISPKSAGRPKVAPYLALNPIRDLHAGLAQAFDQFVGKVRLITLSKLFPRFTCELWPESTQVPQGLRFFRFIKLAIDCGE